MGHAIHDVLVCGGGPAGAAAAIELARGGLRVLLAERSTYAAFRAGEALPPHASALFDRLGVRARFLALDPRPAHAIRSAWGSDDLAETHFIRSPYGDGFHVDRRRLDAMLADAAGDAGATVRRGAHVAEAAREGEGFKATIAGERVHARCVIDATGRGARVASALGARRILFDRMVGVMGVLVPDALTDEAEVLLVEAAREGWWYSAPLPGGALLAAWMTDADELVRSGLRPGPAWERSLEATRHTRARAHAFRRAEAVRVRRAVTSRLDRAAGDGWIAAGDAAGAYDPLSAVGVCKAITSGLDAAAAARAHLDGDGAALGAYAAGIDEAFRTYLRERAGHYRIEARWPASPFWARRRPPELHAEPLTLDPHAVLTAVPGAGPAASAAAESLLPPAAVAWLAGAARAPAPAHVLLERLRSTGLAPTSDRALIVALQLLVEGGALRVVDTP